MFAIVLEVFDALGDFTAYFNVVMVDANKPNFYNSSKPFREVDTTRARVKWDEVTALRPGRVYAQVRCAASSVDAMHTNTCLYRFVCRDLWLIS